MASYTPPPQRTTSPVRSWRESELVDELYGELAQDQDEIRVTEAATAMLQYGTSMTEPKPGTVTGMWYP